MLALGRIDCLILDQQSGDSYARLLGINDHIISLPRAFSINNGYLIIPKKFEMTKFLDEFNSALEKIQKNGTYNKIVKAFMQGVISERILFALFSYSRFSDVLKGNAFREMQTIHTQYLIF